jgi:hypothetical protein
MANPPRGGNLHKVDLSHGLGKSILINPSLTIPMPAGAVAPAPPAAGGQGPSGQAGSGQSAQGSKGNG